MVSNTDIIKGILDKEDKMYSHLDFPLSQVAQKRFLQKMLNPHEVIHHSFSPMISFMIKTQKINGDSVITKNRPIKLTSHHDALIYKLYAQYLDKYYEKYILNRGLSAIPQAYRKKHSSILAAKKAFDKICYLQDAWIIKSDFSHFFDNINHKILIKNTRIVLTGKKDGRLPKDWMHVLNSLIKYRSISKKQFKSFLHVYYGNNLNKQMTRFQYFNQCTRQHKLLLSSSNTLGVPEGTALSAILANVYLIEFDNQIMQLVNKYHGAYYRYSDDFIVIIPGKNADKEVICQLCAQIMEKSKNLVQIKVKKAKTQILHFYNHNLLTINGGKADLNFLGFSFDGETVRLLSSVIYTFHQKAKNALRHLATIETIWNNSTKSNKGQYEDLIKQKEAGFNMPGRKRITKQYLTTKPITKGNTLSYAYNAQKILGTFTTQNGKLYEVDILRTFRRQIARMQKYYHNKLQI